MYLRNVLLLWLNNCAVITYKDFWIWGNFFSL